MTKDKRVDEQSAEEPLPKVWPEGVKLLVEVDKVDPVTAGGIVVPEVVRENARMRLTTAKVLRIGPHASTKFADGKELVPGTRVIFARYGGHWLSEVETRRDLRLINDSDVLAIMEDDVG